jgi:hypothetical protein
MSQALMGDVAKIESLVRQKTQSVDRFFGIAKAYSVRTNHFLEKVYEILFSLLGEDADDLEPPKFGGAQWDLAERSWRKIGRSEGNWTPTKSQRLDSPPKTDALGANWGKYLQLFKEQNREMIDMVMREAGGSASATEQIEKLFAQVRDNNVLQSMEATIEKQRQKIANFKRQNAQLNEQLTESKTKNRLNENQMKALTEELNANSVRVNWEQESRRSAGSLLKSEQTMVDPLKQRLVELTSENEGLKVELENTLANLKHLQRSLVALGEDVCGLFGTVHMVYGIDAGSMHMGRSVPDLMPAAKERVMLKGGSLGWMPHNVDAMSLDAMALRMRSPFEFPSTFMGYNGLIDQTNTIWDSRGPHNLTVKDVQTNISVNRDSQIGEPVLEAKPNPSVVEVNRKVEGIASGEGGQSKTIFSEGLGDQRDSGIEASEWRNSFNPNNDQAVFFQPLPIESPRNKPIRTSQPLQTDIVERRSSGPMQRLIKTSSSTKLEPVDRKTRREFKNELFGLLPVEGEAEKQAETEKFESFKNNDS